MKVLHLPYNIASLISNSICILKKAGIDARGIAYSSHSTQTTSGLICLNTYHDKNFFTKRFLQLKYSILFYRMFKWADIIHWYWDADILPLEWDLRFIKMLNKPGVVEWLGSEIRIPEVEFIDNPYFRSVQQEGKGKADFCSYERSYATQKKFFDAGFKVITTVGMSNYLLPEFFSKTDFSLKQRIFFDEFIPAYPSVSNRVPVIVHAPTQPTVKGTPHIINAVEELKKKYDFEFKLIRNLPREQALAEYQKSDIFVDQLIIGHHGVASVEAMAMGKPVICFIKPSLLNDYPPELPVVSANPDTIYEKLEMLIKDASLRNRLGVEGRKYAEKYHHDKVLAKEMVKIYEQVIASHREK